MSDKEESKPTDASSTAPQGSGATEASDVLSEDKAVDKNVDGLPGEIIPESAVEAREPPPPDITDAAHHTFSKLAVYLQGELEATSDDYKLLEQMNRVTLNKYAEMKQIAVNIDTAIQDLNEKYASLQPYLSQIDQIEESVANMEQAAYKLDAYSKRLEARFKQLEKR